MKHTITLLAALLLAPLASLPAADAPTPKPNVLFIAVDDLRPEMGCYGNTVVKTPNLDRLAARGMVFNRAYCQQAVCSPSRSSLMTGRRPDATKVWDLNTHFRVALPGVVTLPQHFKANGYHAAALSKIYHHGFEDGASWSEPHWYPSGQTVDTDPTDWKKRIVTKNASSVSEYSKTAAPDNNDQPARRANGKNARTGPAFEISPKADDELPDGATAAEAVRRLAALKTKGQPFFLAVGFLKPHLPFVAPKKYWDLYDPGAIPVPAIDHLPAGAPEFAGHNNSELHGYACISYTDAQVGRLLDALSKEGLAENTIVVLWGDHGWQLGDHGLWHKHTNFELAARAPLLISVPRTGTAGQKCDATVEFVDIFPTLADVCGLAIPAGLDGASLKKYFENPAAPATKVAISQYPRGGGPAAGNLMGYSIRDDRWRATFWRERNGSKIVATELYDEKSDPTETVSVHDKPENQAVLAALEKHLPPVVTASNPAPVKANPAAASEPRDARFDRLYPGKTRLTLDEYLAKQSGAEAKDRFTKMDTNNDGIVTREEFISGVRKSDAKPAAEKP
jgi:iduronate 2-sulfatase